MRAFERGEFARSHPGVEAQYHAGVEQAVPVDRGEQVGDLLGR